MIKFCLLLFIIISLIPPNSFSLKLSLKFFSAISVVIKGVRYFPVTLVVNGL